MALSSSGRVALQLTRRVLWTVGGASRSAAVRVVPILSKTVFGIAAAQVVSHRLSTAAARFLTQVLSCFICGGQIGTGAGFTSTRVPPAKAYFTDCSTLIQGGWYNRPTE
jgi:hypothetical protein